MKIVMMMMKERFYEHQSNIFKRFDARLQNDTKRKKRASKNRLHFRILFTRSELQKAIVIRPKFQYNK